MLATSVPVPSIWAIPEDVERDKAKLAQLAKLLEMPLAELDKKLEDEDKTFVWLKRQVDEAVAQQIAALNIKGIYQRKEYKRQYPEGEAAAHVVGFTNVEDHGQEGMELAFNKELAGRPGSRRVIKDRLGPHRRRRGRAGAAGGRASDLQLSVDSKVQFFAYQKLRDAVLENKAKAGSVVVLDAATGEVLALANYPSYVPDKRQNLTGAQLRNRALTDTFEPGSTMKPFIVALALEKGLVHARHRDPDGARTPDHRRLDHQRRAPPRPADRRRGDPEVQQRRHGEDGACRCSRARCGSCSSQVGFGQKPQLPFPGAVSGQLRPYKTWRPIEQATMSYGYGLSASCSSWRAPTRCSRVTATSSR